MWVGVYFVEWGRERGRGEDWWDGGGRWRDGEVDQDRKMGIGWGKRR